ncbi:hypothetical protein P9B04_10085, partial [Crocosphaera sp. Alani8]
MAQSRRERPAWQCLAKLALEPAHEATFHANSFGFRTGRSAHDAQRYVYDNLTCIIHERIKNKHESLM